MKLKLVSKSEVFNNDRYILDHVFDNNIITNDNYQGLLIIDRSLKVVRKIAFEEKFLATFYYFNYDRTCFLAYNEDGFLYYVNLIDPLFTPLILRISPDVSLYPEYIWSENKFIIAAREGDFFCYDVLTNNFYQLDSNLSSEQLTFFTKLNYYKSFGRLYSYDLDKNIFVYSKKNNGHSKIFWKNSSKNIDIELMSPLVDIYRAECVDNLIFLINDESVAFFYLDQEIYRMNIGKEYMTFGARLYKYKGAFYFLLLTTHVRDQRNTIMDLYRVEK